MSTSRSLVPVSESNVLAPYVRYAPSFQPDYSTGERDGFVAVLRRYRLLIMFTIILGGAVGYLLARGTPPLYVAHAQVEIRTPTEPAAPRTGVGSSSDFEQEMGTHIGIIRSRALAQDVATGLGPQGARRLAAALAPAFPGATDAAPLTRAQIADRLRDAVSVSVGDSSRLATISVRSRDPSVSAEVANRYVDELIEGNLRRQYETTVASRRFLTQRLAEARTRLEATEKALNSYQRSAGLIDATGAASPLDGGGAVPQTLASSDLIALNQSYAKARADRIAAEQRWREATRTPLMSLPEVLNNPALQQLAQKSAEARAAYEQQRETRLETHPAVAAAAANIAETNRQIAALAGSVRTSIREQYNVSRRQEADFARTVAQLKNRTLADQGKSVRYNILKREADGSRQLFEGLSQRFNDLTTTAGMASNNISVVDRATPPNAPATPQPLLWAASGAAAALLLSLGSAVVAMVRDDQVHSPESLGANLNLRVLGILPKVRNPLEALSDPASQLSEAHYSLRASLENISPRAASKAILFTSSKVGEGKSTAAFGVARDFALSGKRTLMIDGDMRKPTMQDFVGFDSPMGLSTVLSNLCSDDAAVMPTGVPDLSVMLAGPLPPSPAALLSNGAFEALVKRLSEHFDVIIIDAPPVMGLVDAPRMAVGARHVLFVVEADGTTVREVRSALHRLDNSRVKVAGAVLTKFIIASSRLALAYSYDYPSDPDRLRLEAV